MIERTLENVDTGSPFEQLQVSPTITTTIDALRTRFIDTPYHQLLVNNPPRFGRFAAQWDDNEEFIELFGADVVPDQHGPYQARTIAIPMIEAQLTEKDLPQLSKYQAGGFVAHHVIHDDHEGVLGDAPEPEKNEYSQFFESAVWIAMARHTYSTHEADVFVYDHEVFELGIKEKILHEIWNASEKIGYLYTAFRALQIAETEKLPDRKIKICFDMARQVIRRQSDSFHAYRNNFVFIDDEMQKAQCAKAILAAEKGFEKLS